MVWKLYSVKADLKVKDACTITYHKQDKQCWRCWGRIHAENPAKVKYKFKDVDGDDEIESMLEPCKS